MEIKAPLMTDRQTIPPGMKEFTFTLKGESRGNLIVLGLQDSNDNGEMDTGFFGIPKEGFFCSQNRDIPGWEKCLITYDGGETLLRLKMIYW